jgi:hypothetical protein
MRRCRLVSRTRTVVGRPAVETKRFERKLTCFAASASVRRDTLAVRRMRPVASTSWAPSTNAKTPLRPTRMRRSRRATSMASGRAAGPVTGMADSVAVAALLAADPLAEPPVLVVAAGERATANAALCPVTPPVVTLIRSSSTATGMVAVVALTPLTKSAGAAGVIWPEVSDQVPVPL